MPPSGTFLLNFHRLVIEDFMILARTRLAREEYVINRNHSWCGVQLYYANFRLMGEVKFLKLVGKSLYKANSMLTKFKIT